MDSKSTAVAIRKRMKELGYDEMPIGHAYELLATISGHPSWNVAKTKIEGDIDPLDLVKHQDTDALKWAKSFMQTVQSKSLEVDEGLMLAWFASAIMTMHDRVHNTKVRPLEKKREKLLSLMLLTDPVVSNVEVSDTQLKQHQEFLKAFPDERELLKTRTEK